MPAASPTLALRLPRLVLAAAAILVVLAALTTRPFELDRFFAPKEFVLHLGALTAALLLARRVAAPRTGVDVLLAAWVALTLASALQAANGWLAIRATGVVVSSAAAFWAARTLARAGAGRALVAAVATAGTLAAATSLLQAYGAESDLFSINRAPGGTLGNRNFVAHLAAISLPAAALGVLRGRRRHSVLLSAASVVALSGVLILTRSRGAWLACAAAGIVVAIGIRLRRDAWRERRLGRRLTLFLVLGAMGGLSALLVPNELRWKSDSPYLDSARDVVNYREGSGQGRILQWRNSARLVGKEPLFGVGPGNWPVHYPSVASRRDASMGAGGTTDNPWPSSDWVAFASERGLPATIALLLAMLALLRRGWIVGRRGNRDALLEGSALAATVTATIVAGLFDAVLLLPAPALLAWTAIGALDGASGAERSPAAPPRTATRWFVPLTAALSIALVLFAGRSLLQSLAMVEYGSGDRRGAVAFAARVDPGSYRIRLRAAELGVDRCGNARAASRMLPRAAMPRIILRTCPGEARR